MGVMGVSSITPAFPDIIRHFSISPQQVGLLITFFTIPGIFLTPVLGVLADRFGRKRILIPSLFLFAVGGVGCALIDNFHLLLIFRLIQGMGAASLGSLNSTLIGDIYSGPDRVKAMGLNASVLSIGTASYPAIGGILAHIHWNLPFFLPSLAIPVGIAVLCCLKNPEPQRKTLLKDYLYNAFRFIRKKEAIVLFTGSLATFIILYGSYLTFFPLLLKGKFQLDARLIGFTMSVSSLTTALAASRLDVLRKRMSSKQIIILAYSLYGISMVILVFSPSYWVTVAGIVFFGMGHGTNFPIIQVLLTHMAPLEYRAAFMSMNGMVLRIGQSLGPLITGLAFSLAGLYGAFMTGTFVAAAMILIFAWTFPESRDQ